MQADPLVARAADLPNRFVLVGVGDGGQVSVHAAQLSRTGVDAGFVPGLVGVVSLVVAPGDRIELAFGLRSGRGGQVLRIAAGGKPFNLVPRQPRVVDGHVVDPDLRVVVHARSVGSAAVAVVSCAEDHVGVRVVDVARLGEFRIEYAVDVVCPCRAVVGSDDVMPFQGGVIDGSVAAYRPVVVPVTAQREAQPVVAAMSSELPALAALASLGDVRFPVAVRPALDPGRYRQPVQVEVAVAGRAGELVDNGVVSPAGQVK